jgi:hypothetical protein
MAVDRLPPRGIVVKIFAQLQAVFPTSSTGEFYRRTLELVHAQSSGDA